MPKRRVKRKDGSTTESVDKSRSVSQESSEKRGHGPILKKPRMRGAAVPHVQAIEIRDERPKLGPLI